MILSMEEASAPKLKHVTESLCPPAIVFQTASGHSKSGSIAISVASSWLTWSCRSVVHVNVTINVTNKCIKTWNFAFWKKKCFCMLIRTVTLRNVFTHTEIYMFVNKCFGGSFWVRLYMNICFLKNYCHTWSKFTIVYNSLLNLCPFINLGFKQRCVSKLSTIVVDVFKTNNNKTHFFQLVET